MGDGVFNSDGAMWKFYRSVTRPFFAKDRVSDFETFEKHSEDAIMKIKERDGEPVDFQLGRRISRGDAQWTERHFSSLAKAWTALSTPLALPYIARLGHSTVTRLRSTNIPLSTTLESVLEGYSFRLAIGKMWPLLEIMGDKNKVNVKLLHEFVDPIVERGLWNKSHTRSAGRTGEVDDPEESATLLDHLVSVTDDKTVVRDELLNLLLAGRDTTAHAITAVMYFLVTEDPQIMTTL
ncbi:hypothetical protein FRB98_000942 [Tulasnella sp. 332]|nr:hypothetical protein FRB98_000942 [Tulasnella sp. 332]